MFAAYFAQAGCGATYGIVPLIKKEATGQIAGNVGAYGNFGGVVYLTIFSLTDAINIIYHNGYSCYDLRFYVCLLPQRTTKVHLLQLEGESPETRTKIYLQSEE